MDGGKLSATAMIKMRTGRPALGKVWGGKGSGCICFLFGIESKGKRLPFPRQMIMCGGCGRRRKI